MNLFIKLRGDKEPREEGNGNAQTASAESGAGIADAEPSASSPVLDPIEDLSASSQLESETEDDRAPTHRNAETTEAHDDEDPSESKPEKSETADAPKTSGKKPKHGKHAAPAGTTGNAALLSATQPPNTIGESPDGNPVFVTAGFGEIPTKKRHRGLKAFGITVGVLAVAILAAYIAGAIVFMGRMLPNTQIGEYDISLAPDEEVASMLDGIVTGYQLDIIGDGFSYRTTGAKIGLTIDSDGIVALVHKDLNPWSWPFLIIEPSHDETDLLEVSFKQKTFEPDLEKSIEKYNETATPPVNATIIYDEKSGEFVVKPEQEGTQLDSKSVLASMNAAIRDLEPKLLLTDAEFVQPTVFSNDEKLIEAAKLATGMVSADLTLNMGGQEVGRVNGETLSTFITINENFEVVFNEDELNSWVGNLADGYNTIGTERTFTRADGKTVVVPPGGVYGWEIDTESLKGEILEGIKAGSEATINVPCIDTADVYNGAGQRDWGNRYIDVDLAEQHVRFYGDDGTIIWEADCISGSPDGSHNTVPGTWYVNSKESPSKLIGYENGKKIYETKVTYWMPFEGNGIGFHDATWQPSFGGSMYANGYGSHGCVNLSYSAAQSLYDIIQVGDCVVVHS